MHVDNPKYLDLSLALLAMMTLGNLIYIKVYFFLLWIQGEILLFYNELVKRESAFLLHFSAYL